MNLLERIEFAQMKKKPEYSQMIPLMLAHAAMNGQGPESVYRKIKEKEKTDEQKGTE